MVDRTTMYCQTRLNCEYDKGCPSLSAITYSDLEAALASRRQFTRHLGMGISLLAAFVLSVVEITGLLCSARHARRTEIYGVGASRNTQSHFARRELLPGTDRHINRSSRIHRAANPGSYPKAARPVHPSMPVFLPGELRPLHPGIWSGPRQSHGSPWPPGKWTCRESPQICHTC